MQRLWNIEPPRTNWRKAGGRGAGCKICATVRAFIVLSLQINERTAHRLFSTDSLHYRSQRAAPTDKHNHRYPPQQPDWLKREIIRLKARMPQAVPRNRIWGIDLTGKTATHKSLHATGAGNGQPSDWLTGGSGNDTLIGGAGQDTYIYNKGDGTDFIYDTRAEHNILRFGAGMNHLYTYPSTSSGRANGDAANDSAWRVTA